MTLRLYLVPLEISGSIRGPKYFEYRGDPDPPALISGVNYAMMPFGFEPTALVAADLSAAQVTTMAGLADVTTIPANLDNQLGANLATVQAELEALNLPADVIVATNTYRQVLRGVLAVFAVAQRFYAMRGTQPEGGRLFPPGITLATTLGDLSAGVRQDLQTAANVLGYSYDGLTLASSLRVVLKKLASQSVSVTLLDVGI